MVLPVIPHLDLANFELKQMLWKYQLINGNVAFVICRLQLVCQRVADGFEFILMEVST